MREIGKMSGHRAEEWGMLVLSNPVVLDAYVSNQGNGSRDRNLGPERKERTAQEADVYKRYPRRNRERRCPSLVDETF